MKMRWRFQNQAPKLLFQCVPICGPSVTTKNNRLGELGDQNVGESGRGHSGMPYLDTEAAFCVRSIKSAIDFIFPSVQKSAYRIDRETEGQGKCVKRANGGIKLARSPGKRFHSGHSDPETSETTRSTGDCECVDGFEGPP